MYVVNRNVHPSTPLSADATLISEQVGADAGHGVYMCSRSSKDKAISGSYCCGQYYMYMVLINSCGSADYHVGG